MAPRVSKKERGDLPRPVVQQGTLGFYPLTNLSFSYLLEEHCDVVIGIKDEPETLSIKEKPQVAVKIGKQTERIDLGGRVFNGLSDSFYRGKLPQVIVAVLDVSLLDHFLEEFLDHLDKMFSLGFFLQKPDPVEKLVPAFVVSSNGIFFSNLIRKMTNSLTSMDHVDDYTAQRIIGKFTRGMLDSYNPALYSPGQAVEIEPAYRMKIAGGQIQTQLTIQSVFSGHGLVTSLETGSDNPVERLEFENALKRIVCCILPALAEQGEISKKELPRLEKKVQEAVFQIGQKRKAFEVTETVEMAMDLARKESAQGIISGDPTILQVLSSYAGHFGMDEVQACFTDLREKVVQVSALDA